MYDIIKRRNGAENGHLPYYYNKTPPDLQRLGGSKVSRFEKLTAALAAAFLDMRLKKAIPAIFLGVVIAGLIVSVITYGVTAVL